MRGPLHAGKRQAGLSVRRCMSLATRARMPTCRLPRLDCTVAMRPSSRRTLTRYAVCVLLPARFSIWLPATRRPRPRRWSPRSARAPPHLVAQQAASRTADHGAEQARAVLRVGDRFNRFHTAVVHRASRGLRGVGSLVPRRRGVVAGVVAAVIRRGTTGQHSRCSHRNDQHFLLWIRILSSPLLPGESRGCGTHRTTRHDNMSDAGM